LLRKFSISKVYEEIDDTTNIGKRKSLVIELNEITYTDLTLLIDVKAGNGKFAFNIIRGCKTKDNPDVNGAIAWERLKNNTNLLLRLQW
jgi:hypothetical protein